MDRVTPEVTLTIMASESDIDELGHVSNVVYLKWVIDAAKEHSRRAGYGSHTAFQPFGAVFVVRRHELDYLAPAFAGDLIELVTWIESWKAASSIRHVSIRRDGTELCHCVTTWAFVSSEDGRPRRIPAELSEAYANLD